MHKSDSAKIRQSMPIGTFVLGVGCQKGGTSWLFDQLAKSHDFVSGFTKEFHVFDEIYNVPRNYRLPVFQPARELDGLRSPADFASASLEDKKLITANFRGDTEKYFDYFESLLAQPDNASVTADITPAYAGMPCEAYELIDRQFSKRNIQSKVLFVMRDPVERIWSQIRMRRRKMKAKGMNVDSDLSDEKAIVERYKTKAVEVRTDYKSTINNIESVFDGKDILYILFEELFTTETQQRLENFLQIELNSYEINTKVNESPKLDPTLDEKVIKEITAHYKDTYLFCDSRFKIRHKWKYFKYIN